MTHCLLYAYRNPVLQSVGLDACAQAIREQNDVDPEKVETMTLAFLANCA